MDAVPVPDWIREDPAVQQVTDFHLPVGSGISGPPAGAFLMEVQAENAIRPIPMWHVLLQVSDEDLEMLERYKLLVLAVSVVPIFQVYPFDRPLHGSQTMEEDTDG